MSDLINLGDIGKPFTDFGIKIIEKISDAIGGFFRPHQMKRVAHAESEIALQKAEIEIQIEDLKRRTIDRRLAEDMKQQQNIEGIIRKSLPHVKSESDPQKMDDDWIAHFFDKSRLVSDEEMQLLWAKILAEETNIPGRFSKRTLNLVSELSKEDASRFADLCRFCWTIGEQPHHNLVALIFDTDDIIYRKNNIGLGVLANLDSMGLLKLHDNPKVLNIPTDKCPASYFGQNLLLDQSESIHIPAGYVILSEIGQQLFPISNAKPVEGFFEYVKDKWKGKLIQQ